MLLERQVGYPSKVNNFFDFPQYSMDLCLVWLGKFYNALITRFKQF